MPNHECILSYIKLVCNKQHCKIKSNKPQRQNFDLLLLKSEIEKLCSIFSFTLFSFFQYKTLMQFAFGICKTMKSMFIRRSVWLKYTINQIKLYKLFFRINQIVVARCRKYILPFICFISLRSSAFNTQVFIYIFGALHICVQRQSANSKVFEYVFVVVYQEITQHLLFCFAYFIGTSAQPCAIL